MENLVKQGEQTPIDRKGIKTLFKKFRECYTHLKILLGKNTYKQKI